MAEQIAAKRPNFYSCSPRVVGGSPCPMVLRDQCRNCSDCLNPPYSALFDRFIPPNSVHPQASACAQEPRGSSPTAAGIDQPKPLKMKQLIAQGSVNRWGIDGSEDIGKLAIPLPVFEQFIEHGHGRHTTWCLCGRCISCEDLGSQPISNRQF